MNGAFAYHQPARLADALAVLAGGRHRVLAGGTDYYPARVGRLVEDDIVDITRLPELRGISHDGAAVRIGAAATWRDIIEADLPPCFNGLKAAAREVGGLQIQNAGTVAGNLCNASPAADGVPPLMALDAEVELASARGVRRVRLTDFILGSRRTVRAADELALAVYVPAWPARARGAFCKLGHRRYLVISIVMVAATVALDADGAIERCAIAVGACSAVAMRLPMLEARLPGMPAAEAAAGICAADLAPLAPIDDIRGSAAYRQEAALVLVRQALLQAVA